MNSAASSKVTETKATETLRAARKYQTDAEMASSAVLCADDAEALIAKGDFDSAHKRALKSLAYAVGILSSVYSAHS